tara:strand:+ start:899 stop:1504 length:606 start_codon:yes stop_codon:yes gene_type:complete
MFYSLPETDTEAERWAYWNGAFSEEELDEISVICKELTLEPSTITGMDNMTEEEAAAMRNNNVAWLPPTKRTDFIYKVFSKTISKVNSAHFRFDLSGMFEELQYSEYAVGEHFNAWHADNFDGGMPTYDLPRKFTLSMQMSRPEEYEGGDLQLRYGQTPVTAERNHGHMVFFPSTTLHRVKPVTKGMRKSLVAWAGGPRFR